MNDNTELTASLLPAGFQWGAVRAGIKASGNLDLAVAIAHGSGSGAAVGAAMFTTNRVVAAPVTVGRRHLAATGGRVAAVLVNSGNANCATGEPGIEGCVATCVAAAEMVRAGVVLVVGRSAPVLRSRERQWIAIMAELADHGWRELA